MTWFQAVEVIEPHVVRISTPRGFGSGFLVSHGVTSSEICAIATAAHVIDLAHYWEEPIRIDHVSSGKSLLIRHHERSVRLDAQRDTAAILFLRGELPFPEERLPLAPQGRILRVGNEIGWIGFPAFHAARPCFFGGRVSARLPDQDQGGYLVDGVAINGVSGGPAFFLTGVEENPVIVIGVLSAYVPNRATGEALPGLSMVRDVEQFHAVAQTFASLEQAKSQESPPAMPPTTTEGEAERGGTDGPLI